MNISPAPSPNFWSYNLGRKLIVLHGTAGSAWASIGWLRNPNAQASSNYLITLLGEVYCLVDPYKGYSAWANGDTGRPDMANPYIAQTLAGDINPNLVSISIEHEAASADMIAHNAMPPAQEKASKELVAQLCRDFNLPISRERIIGHYQINSITRPNCPGVINLDRYVSQLQASQPEKLEMQLNGHTIRGEILLFWRKLFNPLLVLGFPLTEEYRDRATDLTTQVFERAVLEFRPENIGTEWGPVQGRNLGSLYKPANIPAIYNKVAGDIKAYRDRLFNPLLVLGLPISDEYLDGDGSGRRCQWFERGLIKIHPEFKGSDWAVMGERLGAKYLAANPVQIQGQV